MTTRKRYSDDELKALQAEWYGPDGKLAQSGFEDLEAYRPDRHGDKQPLLAKGDRFVSIHALMPDDEDALPEDEPIFDFYEGPTYLKFQVLEGLALHGILTRQDWEAVTALSLFCEGTSERQVAKIIGRSRGKTIELLRKFKQAVDTPGKVIILGSKEEEN